jgi:hypothetical protein
MIRPIPDPPPEKVVRDRERMRAGKPVRMFPPDHQGRLRAIEPARIFEFRVIDDNILV